jgi:hypothetical protein
VTVTWNDNRRESFDCSGPNAYQLEIQNFCRAVAGSEPPRISANETLGVLSTIEMVETVAVRRPVPPTPQGAPV